MTIQELIQSAANALRGYSDAPRLDADRIVLHILGQREPSYLIAHTLDELSAQQIQTINQMGSQRKIGMPLAYILGEADFYGRMFIVTPDVLIPRPDTEALIEKALEYIQTNLADKKEITIADIGTGSGIIAITLAHELSSKLSVLSCKFIATDISPTALAIAKQNAEKHSVLEKVEFIQGNMLEPIKNRHVDLIVSNPPYIRTAELDAINYAPKPYIPNSKETPWNTGLLFEPRIALDGGQDGQKFVNQIKQSSIPAIIETTGGDIITLVRPLPSN